MSDTHPLFWRPSFLRNLDRRQMRRILMLGVPALALLVGGAFYLLSGRYVSTENAYVKADMVLISPDVGGRIVRSFVAQNQTVKAGDPLFEIDPEPYRIHLAEAEARLREARSTVLALKARYRTTLEQLDLARINIDFYEREFARQEELARKRVAAQAKLDEATHNLQVAQQLASVLKQNLGELIANLGGDPEIPVEEHPTYLQAKAARDNAALDLERTIVRAPFDGVTGKKPESGDHVTPNTPVVSLISHSQLWIEANFKETQITHVRPGQAVSIEIDTYPDRRWRGHVASIAQGTGAEFSVLPAQNATGNWVKVVQRVPVRIAIDTEPGDPPIRAGMSAEVEIDTAAFSGTAKASAPAPGAPPS